MSGVVVEADWQAVSIGRTRILGPTRISIAARCWTAVIGPNGAGKSTLLRSLAGLQPVDGEVRLQGRALRTWPARERARVLAWLGQGDVGEQGLTAHQIVMLGRLPHRHWLAPPGDADAAAVETAMQRTQCWQWRDRAISTLSGGERQRVLLARALAVEAPVLLMDEPLTHLDPPHQADWVRAVRHLVAQHGASVVSVLHELNIALMADRLIIVGAGRVVHHGSPADAETRRALQSVFDGRLRLLHIEDRWIALPADL
jgi:iron complex transport system ATP-binding protein